MRKSMKVLFRTSLTLAGVCLSYPSFADSRFEGFFGNISTGYEDDRFSNIKPSWINLQNPTTHNGTGSASPKNVSQMTLVLGLGYFHPIDGKFMLGVGADHSPLANSTKNFSHHSVRVDGFEFDIKNMKYEISNRADAFLMPAYALDTDKLLYGKLGYSTAKLKYTQGADPAVGLTSGFESATQLNGFILGVGYKQTIQDGIYGFVEANHIEYGRKNISGSGSSSGEEIRFNSSPSVTVNNILVGIGYNFGYAN